MKKKVGLVAVIGVLVTGIVVAGLNWKSLSNGVRKLLMSPTEYYCYVEAQEAKKASDGWMTLYESILEYCDISKEKQHNNKINVSLEDELKEIIKELDESVYEQVKEIDSVGLGFSGSSYDAGKKHTFGAELLLNDTPMVRGDFLLDIEAMEVFLGFSEIAERYLYNDFEDLFDIDEAETMKQVLEVLPDVIEQLPDKKETYKLFERYRILLLENLSDIEEKKTSLKVEGISQTCTAYSTELDATEIREMMLLVLKELRDDEEIEEYINGIASVLVAIDDLDMDEDLLYELFTNYIEEGIEFYEELLEEEDEDEYEPLEITVWVDNKGNVIGRKYEMKKEFLFNYGLAIKGNSFGLHLQFSTDDDILELKGNGDISKGNCNGTFTLDIIEERIVAITLEELSLKSLKNGEIKGKLTLLPEGETEELVDVWNEEDYFQLKDPKILVAFDAGKKESIISVSFENDGKSLGDITLTHKEDVPEKKEFPKKTDAFDVKNDEDVFQWIYSLDADSFEEKLQKQGLLEDTTKVLGDWIRDIQYYYGKDLFLLEDYKNAKELFELQGDYKDAQIYVKCCDAMFLYEEGKIDEALAILEEQYDGDYYISSVIRMCKYKKAEALMEEEKYSEAIELYEDMGYYSDSEYRLEYAWGKKYLADGEYEEAEYHFGLASTMIDVSEDLKECKYQAGIKAMELGRYGEAYAIFNELSGYKDADALKETADEEIAIMQAPMGQILAPDYEYYAGLVTIPEQYTGIEMDKLTEQEFQEYVYAHVKEKMGMAMGPWGDIVWEPEVRFSDAAASFMSNGKYPTEESYKAYLRMICEDEKYTPILREYLLNTSSVPSHDEEYIRKQLSKVLFAFSSELAQYGVDIDTYIRIEGYNSFDEFRSEREQVILENDTILIAAYAIAKKEGLVITEEMFLEMADEFAYEYGITTEHFLELNDRKVLEQIFMIECGMEFMIDNANFIEKE